MKLAIVVAVVLCAARGEAGPLADAIAHHDVDALRARLPDRAAKCALGVVLAGRGELPRAGAFLDDCDGGLPDEISDEVARAAAAVQRKLRASQLSSLSIVTNPAGLVVETDALPGERLTAPATVWARAGTYRVRASGAGTSLTAEVTLEAHSRGSVVLGAGVAKVTTPTTAVADFTHDNAGEAAQAGSPPNLEHPSLLPPKYRDGGTTGGPQLDDPFAIRVAAPPPVPPAWRLGARLGGGLFDHAGASRIGTSVAAIARVGAPWQAAASHPFELELRGDYSRRGLGTAGVDVGIDKVVAAPDAAWLSVGAALRGELRTGDMLDGAAVRRTGLGVAGSVELALRALPMSVGARVEQGLTELVPGVRERAIVVELGLDWRSFR